MIGAAQKSPGTKAATAPLMRQNPAESSRMTVPSLAKENESNPPGIEGERIKGEVEASVSVPTKLFSDSNGLPLPLEKK